MIPAATVCIENSRSEIGSDFRPGVLLYFQQLRQPQRRDIDEVMILNQATRIGRTALCLADNAHLAQYLSTYAEQRQNRGDNTDNHSDLGTRTRRLTICGRVLD